jgi:hypothetical protein
MVYASYITLKNKSVLNSCEFFSIDKNGEIKNYFDPLLPAINVTYNCNGSLLHPSYKHIDIQLNEVWLIGVYSLKERIYTDNSGVIK